MKRQTVLKEEQWKDARHHRHAGVQEIRLKEDGWLELEQRFSEAVRTASLQLFLAAEQPCLSYHFMSKDWTSRLPEHPPNPMMTMIL